MVTMVGNGIVKSKGAKTALFRRAARALPPLRFARYSKFAPVESACSIRVWLCSMIRPPYNAAPANRITTRMESLRDLLLTLSEDNTRAQRKESIITHGYELCGHIDGRQSVAVVECVLADGGQRVGQHYGREFSALGQCIFANGGAVVGTCAS